VSYESADWLRLNLDLVTRLNPEARFRWLVVENTPPDSAKRLGDSDPGFELFPGRTPETRPYGTASYHHAAGLGMITHRVSTRYLLILDPDFFIIRKHWITDIITHMRASDVALLGAPWHPKRTTKFRYFPCAHCTFIDLDRIRKDTLDFSPDYEGDPDWLREKIHRPSRKNSLLSRLTFAKRRRIGTARDTGWHVFQRYHKDPSLLIECFQPVFQPKTRRLVTDTVLPDRLSLTPKRRDYFSKTGFPAYGLPDLQANGWEEFLWRQAPFGFHVRCYPIRDKKSDQPMDAHYRAVQDLLKSLGITG